MTTNSINNAVETLHATSLPDLMRFEYLVQSGRILPDRPIYSILTGRHPAKMRGRGLDLEEVRQYVPGDDIRNIDWRVTARTNETYSKVYNEEKERPTFTILDQSSAMFFGSQLYVKSVTAAHITAISAFYTIKRGDRFGGLVFNEDGYDYVAPKRSKALVQHFLQLTVDRNNQLPFRKKTDPNPDLLNEMLDRARMSITHDYVVSVVTDIMQLNDVGKRCLRSMSLHNNIILVHVEDPMDRVLPDGKIVLTDGEDQIIWNNSKKDTGKKYTSDYEQKIFSLTEELRHYGIPVSIINTLRPVEEQIIQKMGARLS